MRSKKKNESCCITLVESLQGNNPSVYYDPMFRAYYIALLSPQGLIHPIYHCPWCGTKFPRCLNKDYLDVLRTELSINRCICTGKYYKEDEDFNETVVNVPNEFKSDEWWKKRNL